MTELEAIDRVRAHIMAHHPGYPTSNLAATQFSAGWTVFNRIDPRDISQALIGQTIFLIGDDGTIVESSSSLPPGAAEAEFARRHDQR